MGVTAALAFRGLRAQPLSVALLVIAIAIGVGFQIPNTANLAGSSAMLLDEGLVWGSGDVRVEPRGRLRFGADDMAGRIARALPGSRTCAMIVLPGGIAVSGSRFVSAPVMGIDFATAPIRISRGTVPASGELGVVLGSALARRVQATLGGDVELRVVLGDPGSAIEDGGAYTMKVRGVAGNSAADDAIFVNRAFLAAELGDPGAASTMLVYLEDHDAAAIAAATIERAIPGVRGIDWRADDPFLPAVLRANRMIERVSYGMVVAAISVPLLALFYVRALRMQREIAVLRALGFTRRDVFAIHVVQALVIGCAGSVLGAAIGAIGIAVFARHPIFTWDSLVVRPLAEPATFAAPIAAAIATAMISGAVAAWQAARTDPARVLSRLS